ncbi:unnamed protein product, partial [Ectocarpus sp. 4 AP-2014]
WSVVSAPRAAKPCTAKKLQQKGSFGGASRVTVRKAATGARQGSNTWGTRKHGRCWVSGLRVFGQAAVMIAIFNRTLSGCEPFWNTWNWKAGYSIAMVPPKTQSTPS